MKNYIEENVRIELKLPNDKQWKEAERRVEVAMQELRNERTVRQIISSIQ
jgi:hypothetical protein